MRSNAKFLRFLLVCYVWENVNGRNLSPAEQNKMEVAALETANSGSGTTQFVDNGGLRTQEYEVFDLIDEHKNSFASDERARITDFLSKPIIFSSGNFSITDTVGGALNQWYCLSTIFNSLTQSDLFKSKVKGYLGFRATTCFKIVVNGNRFQQGRYMLSWIPTGGVSSVSDWQVSHSANLMQRTQLPHVEIDIASTTSAEFRVPYLTAFPYYSLNTPALSTDVGIIQLWAYSPLVAPTGSTVASYTIFVWFEDVELVTPVIPQSGGKRIVKKKDGIVAAKEQEQAVTRIKPVSHALRQFSGGIATLGAIPLLTPFTEPLSWATGIASDIASYFGWSTPNNLAPVDRTKIDPAFGWNNCDSARMPHKLSLMLESSVTNYPNLSLDGQDELAFEHLAGRFSYYKTLTFTETDSIGDTLASYTLSPASFYNLYTDAAVQLKQHTPMSFVAQHFEHWKCDFVFRLKFVKTEFHSGRLALVYLPYNAYAIAPSITLEGSAYLNRSIVDIRDGSEIEIVCPYRSIYPFLDRATPMGKFGILVADKLVAPDSVSSSISILVEVAARNVNFQNFQNKTPFMPVVATTFQAGPAVGIPQELIVQGMLGAPTTQTVTINESCTGEKVMSFRQLMKRYVGLPYFAPLPALDAIVVHPYWAAWIPSGLSGSTTGLDGCGDMYSTLASIFAFYKGGIRVAGEVRQTSRAAISWRQWWNTTSVGLIGTAVGNKGLNYWTSMYSQFSLDTAQFTEVESPQYNQAYARPCAALVYTPAVGAQAARIPLGAKDGNTPYAIMSSQAIEDEVDFEIWRATADDGNFSTFVSIPYTQYSDSFYTSYYVTL